MSPRSARLEDLGKVAAHDHRERVPHYRNLSSPPLVFAYLLDW